MKKRVLLASPVKQKKAILSEFLNSLQNLDTSGLCLDFVFIDDHNDHDVLYEFARETACTRVYPSEYQDHYLCDETTHHWEEGLIWKVAAFKDQFIERALSEGYDYLFLVDSDLYLHPKTLVHLLSLAKDIVSEVFWTRWEPDFAPLPQVWLGDQYRLYEKEKGEILSDEEIQKRTQAFLQMLSVPGVYRVGGLGACTLISREALQRGLSFKPIYNLSFIGEDRYFCIRAAALGLELFADTQYPPFHIYRESELMNLQAYKEQITPTHAQSSCTQTNELLKELSKEAAAPKATVSPAKVRNSIITKKIEKENAKKQYKITLAMLVRNEADRYLRRTLENASQFIDQAVILDDASEDNTIEVCRQVLTANKIPFTIAENKISLFSNEILLRKQLWEITTNTQPDWILILDADEMFEEEAATELRRLANRYAAVDYYAFRLYDLWTEDSYREDRYWSAHKTYRPFMVKYIPGFQAQWLETPQHCGRFPLNINELKGEASSLRIKHLGWMKPEDRLKKYYRYKALDPNGSYGIIEQYQSILQPKPNLVSWNEKE